MLRRLSLIALAFVLLTLPLAPSATAKEPPGDWTVVHEDFYIHYACKARATAGAGWRILTATWFNGEKVGVREGIGAYAAIARGSNRNQGDSMSSANWRNGYVRMHLTNARWADRLWVQAAAYGPPRPWTDGFNVSRITNCKKAKSGPKKKRSPRHRIRR